MSNKKYVIEANFIRVCDKLELSLSEFLLLMYFENADSLVFNLDDIANKLKIKKESILYSYNNLLSKNIISVSTEKNKDGKYEDIISLDGLYESLTEENKQNEKKKTKEDIFSKFEEEFRRPLSGTEFEVIKAWIEKMYSEEVILKALEEAVYNGATNIRYIDTILYEWNKLGLKNRKDIEDHIKNRYEKKKIDETNVFDYNWLDDDDK